jgi:hypothetical protein
MFYKEKDELHKIPCQATKESVIAKENLLVENKEAHQKPLTKG